MERNRQRLRFEVLDDDVVAGFLDYRVRDGRYWLTHTEISDTHSGTGAASFLVRGALDELAADQRTIVPTCPFVAGWIRRHPEYKDLVDESTLRAYKRSRNAGRRRTVTRPRFDPKGETLGPPCVHAPTGSFIEPTPWPIDGCADCLEQGRRDWVHLRVCIRCGRVGCCDNSPGQHATAHYAAERHELIRSYEPGENWWFCYADVVTFAVEGATPMRDRDG